MSPKQATLLLFGQRDQAAMELGGGLWPGVLAVGLAAGSGIES